MQALMAASTDRTFDLWVTRNNFIVAPRLSPSMEKNGKGETKEFLNVECVNIIGMDQKESYLNFPFFSY